MSSHSSRVSWLWLKISRVLRLILLPLTCQDFPVSPSNKHLLTNKNAAKSRCSLGWWSSRSTRGGRWTYPACWCRGWASPLTPTSTYRDRVRSTCTVLLGCSLRVEDLNGASKRNDFEGSVFECIQFQFQCVVRCEEGVKRPLNYPTKSLSQVSLSVQKDGRKPNIDEQ